MITNAGFASSPRPRRRGPGAHRQTRTRGMSPLETGVHGKPLQGPRRTSGWSSRGAASPYGGARAEPGRNRNPALSAWESDRSCQVEPLTSQLRRPVVAVIDTSAARLMARRSSADQDSSPLCPWSSPSSSWLPSLGGCGRLATCQFQAGIAPAATASTPATTAPATFCNSGPLDRLMRCHAGHLLPNKGELEKPTHGSHHRRLRACGPEFQ